MRVALLGLLAACSGPSERLTPAHREAIAAAEVMASEALGRVRLTRLSAGHTEIIVVFAGFVPRDETCVVAYRLRDGKAPERLSEIAIPRCPDLQLRLQLPACDPLVMARRVPIKMLGVATVEWLDTRGWLALDGSERLSADHCR
jgi:hypothetical protein